MAIVEFSNVTFRYHPEEEPILEDFSFSVERGEFVSIIGQSGCGKSTLFRLLTGLETPQKGEIRINGKPVQKGSHLSVLTMLNWRRRLLGSIPWYFTHFLIMPRCFKFFVSIPSYKMRTNNNRNSLHVPFLCLGNVLL